MYMRENQKNSRRLELSMSKKKHPARKVGARTRAVWTQCLRQVCLSRCPKLILEFKACRGSGHFFRQFSRNFPGTFIQNSRADPRNSHSLLEFSERREQFVLFGVFFFFFFQFYIIFRFKIGHCPVLPLILWDSLVNFKQGGSLVICVFSLAFPRIEWVGQGTKIPG